MASTLELLRAAQAGGYAVGAFNVYNLEGALAVVAAAEQERCPAILQIHPAALVHGGSPLVALCLEAARRATVPMAVHLDHCTDLETVRAVLAAGLTSVMADGSRLDYEGNVAFTAEVAAMVHARGGCVEAELGRLAGTEDELRVEGYQARLTDPDVVGDFVSRTGVDMLAVCIGNVHGKYPGPPVFDFERLRKIRERVTVPLVLHGTSGVPEAMVRRCIAEGVCKFNVNTEIRAAYVTALRERLTRHPETDLLPLMKQAQAAMTRVIASRMRLFAGDGSPL